MKRMFYLFLLIIHTNLISNDFGFPEITNYSGYAVYKDDYVSMDDTINKYYPNLQGIHPNASVCYGTNETINLVTFEPYSSYSITNLNIISVKSDRPAFLVGRGYLPYSLLKKYQGYTCLTPFYINMEETLDYIRLHHISNWYESSGYFSARDYKFNILSVEPLESSSCLENPLNEILSGYAYQGIFANDSDCSSAYNDNGDGNNYLFANPNLNSNCSGFCYYNTPSTTNIDTQNNTSNTDTSTDLTDTNTQTNTNDTTINDNIVNTDSFDLSAVIPYIDNLENLNTNIDTSLQNLNTNLNSKLDTMNINNTNVDNSLQNIDTSISSVNTNLINIQDSLNNIATKLNTENNINEEDLSDITNDFKINPDISSELDSYKSTIETNISNSFTNYGDVFGFGGFASAPEPISFTILGTSFNMFDVSILNPYIENIRSIFLISAYILGLFLVFKGI